jgi:hypothetical protein
MHCVYTVYAYFDRFERVSDVFINLFLWLFCLWQPFWNRHILGVYSRHKVHLYLHFNPLIVEDKMRRCKGKCAHFSFNKCPIYTHDGASAKFSTNSHETDNTVVLVIHTVIRFLWVSAKFGTCTVASVNGTQVEDKMRRFKSKCAHFSFNKCPIYTHDGASAKFSTRNW